MKILKNKVISILSIVFFVGLLSLILTPQALLSQNQFPKPVGHVNDFANVIPAATERKIAAICLEVKQKTGAEIAILTVETIGDQQYTDYTIRLMEDENWQLGEQGKDNGVLIFQTVQERKFRIEVGYGLEGIIPDGLAGEIRDRYVFPFFKKGDYGNGLLAGTQAIAGIIARDAGVEITGAVRINQDRRAVRRKSPVASLFKFFLIALIFLFFRGGGRGRRRGSGVLPWLLLGGLMSGGRGYGGFSGGGSFGGGFGGFGGGGFGGGGAGGSY